MGKSAVIVDTSLDSAEVAAAQQTRDDVDKNAKNAEEGDVAVASNEGVERPGERAFENLTDLQNEEFVFVF